MESSPPNYLKISHHFKFNFSQIKHLPAEQFVPSPVFHALGHDWVVDCYPRGSHEGLFSRDYTAFLLRLQGDYKKIDITFSCSLMKKDGTTCPLPNQFSIKKGTLYLQFIGKRSPFPGQVFAYADIPQLQLEKNFVNNDSFEFICSISDADTCIMRVPKSFDLNKQIASLLLSKETTDVTFTVKNHSFTGHRIILASRSPVLKAELFGNMAEARQKHIEIEDMLPEVFEAMLCFMYTDSFPYHDSDKASTKMAQHLLVAADRYAIEGLKAICEKLLCTSISLDLVASNLALAEQHNSPWLKNTCLDFISKPEILISWILTDEYIDLVRSFPSIKADIRAKVNATPFFKDVQM